MSSSESEKEMPVVINLTIFLHFLFFRLKDKLNKAEAMSSVITQKPSSQSPTYFMLPYGYQIDLDFIKYCENLTQLDPTDGELQRRQRRRQRQSMEVMLGIQMEMQNQMDELSEFWDRKPPSPPPRTHHHFQIESPIVPRYTKPHHQTEIVNYDPSLNDVMDDFEKTLERSKKGKDIQNREKSRHSESGKTNLNQPNFPKLFSYNISSFQNIF